MSRSKYERPGGLFDHPLELLSIAAVVLALSWIWFVGSLNPHEMILGAVVVALCTGFVALVLRSETLKFDLRLKDVLQARRIPKEIAKDTGVLIAVLFRDLFLGQRAGSYYRVCGFKSSRRDPILVARSALATMYSTISPNMIVIGIDPAQNHMLFHQVKRDEVAGTAQSLGAGQ